MVEVFTLMSVSSVDGFSDPGSGIGRKSRNEYRISISEAPMLTPAELVRLPKVVPFGCTPFMAGASPARRVLPSGSDIVVRDVSPAVCWPSRHCAEKA